MDVCALFVESALLFCGKPVGNWCVCVCTFALVCCVCASVPTLDSRVPPSCEELQGEVRRVMEELREEVNSREAVSDVTRGPPRTLLLIDT